MQHSIYEGCITAQLSESKGKTDLPNLAPETFNDLDVGLKFCLLCSLNRNSLANFF